MLKIRLARGGAKKSPYYRLVVTHGSNARDSGAIKEKIGYFNPVAKGDEDMIHIDVERFEHWLSKGAKASEKVARLLVIFKKAQITGKKAVMRSKPEKAKPVITEETAKSEAKAEESTEPEAEKATEPEAKESADKEAED